MPGAAQSIDTEELVFITPAEYSALKMAMENRGIGGDIQAEVVYDANNDAAFLMGITESGYLIMSKETLRCMESGEGNPYSAYQGTKKYYGGPLCYYVTSDNQYYDVGRNVLVSEVPYSENLRAAVTGIQSVGTEVYLPSASATASVTKTVILPNALNWVKRKAFGYNDDDTCSAVACTLALQYIDYYNADVVPTQYHLEYLTSKATADNVATKYPKANAFHHYLTNTCGMGAASFCDAIVTGIEWYCDSSQLIEDTNLRCEWAVNVTGIFAKNYLDDDRPAMLTSTLAGEYSWHTMLIYGYRELSDGSTEWLVHPGWYSKVSQNTSTGYYQVQEVWVSASTATFLYRFRYIKE